MFSRLRIVTPQAGAVSLFRRRVSFLRRLRKCQLLSVSAEECVFHSGCSSPYERSDACGFVAARDGGRMPLKTTEYTCGSACDGMARPPTQHHSTGSKGVFVLLLRQNASRDWVGQLDERV